MITPRTAAPVAELEVVAGRVEVVPFASVHRRGATQNAKHERARAPPIRPTTTRSALAIGEPGGADRRARADVGGQHRREDQPGTEAAAGDEELAARPDEARGPEAEADDAEGVDDEEGEMKVSAFCICILIT